MMRKLTFALLLALALPAHAIDGATLQEWCHQFEAKAPGVDPMTFRDGYCMGVTEGIIALSRQKALRNFCPPAEMGGKMLLRTLLNYLDAKPQVLAKPVEVLIPEALGYAYPCEKSPAENTTEETGEAGS